MAPHSTEPCPRCGEEPPVWGRTCSCSKRLPIRTRCLYCGFYSARAYRVCPECGNVVFRSRWTLYLIATAILAFVVWVALGSMGGPQGRALGALSAMVWVGATILTVRSWLRSREFARIERETEQHIHEELGRVQAEQGADGRAATEQAMAELDREDVEAARERARQDTEHPFLVGLKYSTGLLVAMAVLLVAVGPEGRPPLVMKTAAAVGAFGVAACFAYAYAARHLGKRAAVAIFTALAGVVLCVGVAVMVHLMGGGAP